MLAVVGELEFGLGRAYMIPPDHLSKLRRLRKARALLRDAADGHGGSH